MFRTVFKYYSGVATRRRIIFNPRTVPLISSTFSIIGEKPWQVHINGFSSTTAVINTKPQSQTKNDAAGCEYTVDEVQIPKMDGHLAGKLWKGADNPTSGHSGGQAVKEYSPILCVHGWLDNCCSFDTLIPLIIKPNMTILAIDLPGHGFSSHTMTTHYDNVIDSYYALIKTIQHFHWDKVTLLGHSMGSIASFTFAGLFPELVDRYIALDNLRPIPGEPVALMRKSADVLLQVDRKLSKRLPPPSYTYEEILQKSYEGRKKSISLEGCKILLQRGACRTPDGKYSFSHDLRVTIPTTLGKFSSYQTLEIGKSIKAPICVIKGEPGNDYEPREAFMEVVEKLKETAPYVEFHTVPGTHHFHLNDPQLVAPIINKFLDLHIGQK